MFINRKVRLAVATGCLFATAIFLHPAEAKIERDRYGVPHIQVEGKANPENIKALFMDYGLTVAQDRLFQLDMVRRMFSGRVSELLGQEHIESDKLALLKADLASYNRQIQELESREYAILEGYVEGVNNHIDSIQRNRSPLPEEYASRNLGAQDIAYFTPVDVIAIFAGIFDGFGDFNSEATNLKILHSLVDKYTDEKARLNEKIDQRALDKALDVFSKLFWHNDPRAYATARADHPDVKNIFSGGAHLSHAKDALALVRANPQLLRDERKIAGLDLDVARSASNAWLVGKERADKVDGIMINGPQPGWFNPSYFNEVELVGAGFNMIGMAFFGLPILPLGHNDHIGWGITSANADQVDLYLLEVDPRNSTYRTEGMEVEGLYSDFHIITKRVATIRVRGGQDIRFPIYMTPHGTIFHLSESEPLPPVVFARNRAWEGREVSSLMSWVRMNRAQSYEEWRQAIAGIAYGLNFYYIDTRGQIAYQLAGRFPMRDEYHDFRIPAVARSGMDWKGRLDFEKNAHIAATTQGYIANWNNKPSPNWPNPDKFWSQWAPVDRVNTIVQHLEGGGPVSAPDMLKILRNTSFADLNLSSFLPYMQAAVRCEGRGSSGEGELVDYLSSWKLAGAERLQFTSGGSVRGDPGEAIMDAWLRALLGKTILPLLDDSSQRVYGSTSRQKRPPFDGDQVKAGVRAVYRELAQWDMNNCPAFPADDIRHPDAATNIFNGPGPWKILHQSLAAARKELGVTFKSANLEDWRHKLVPQVFFEQSWTSAPFANKPEELPFYMNRGGANMMLVVQGGKIQGRSVMPPGQGGVGTDGKPGPHADDQLDLYKNFRMKLMERMFANGSRL